MGSNLYLDLCNIVGKDFVSRNEPMRRHTSFKIGGPADFYVMPDQRSIAGLMEYCRKNDVPYTVIGNGSNLLCGDGGVEGVVIEIGRRMAAIEIDVDRVIVQAGALLSTIAAAAAQEGLTGFEFASGIPGSVGGAVVMNAGAYGGEMKDVLGDVTVLTQDCGIITVPADELELSYRSSVIPERGWLVLSATILLKKGRKEEINAKINELKNKRCEKQPLEYPSAGSTFKRPEGYFAGKLIEEAGLKGFCCGGAQVSEKHCGFVINRDNATAVDVRNLMKYVQNKVKDESGVELEPEVKFIGRF